jgi:MoaA/NifB/PqqE/SkfB family radical SAM enzyme
MAADLHAWRHTAIRNKIQFYRLAHVGYGVASKPSVDLGNGIRAFSPLHPPIGSRVARRRVRLIVGNMAGAGAAPGQFSPTAPRTPHVATIAVTYACQCNCSHCSAEPFREDDANRALSFDELAGAIRQTIDLGTTSVVLTGGEPLLHPRLYDLIRAVDAARSLCTIFTNGEYLDEACVSRLKDAGLFGLFVSLDHATAAAHDRNRARPGLFDKAVQGLINCRNAGIPTGISTYVTREKLAGEMDELMELGRRLGVLEVFVFDVTPSGRLKDRPDCVLTDGEVAAMKKLRLHYHDLPDYPRIIHQTMFSGMAYPCVAEGCPAAMVQLHIRANGDVTPCDFTPLSFGNIRQRPLEDIWRSMTADGLYADMSARCRLSQPEFRARLAERPHAAV